MNKTTQEADKMKRATYIIMTGQNDKLDVSAHNYATKEFDKLRDTGIFEEVSHEKDKGGEYRVGSVKLGLIELTFFESKR